MTTFEALMAGGDPVDPDLVSILAAEGVETPEAAHALGEAHWVRLFADRSGFTRDFDELLESHGLTWESAVSAPSLDVSPDELEVGVAAMVVAQQLGAERFSEVFQHSREAVMRRMAERSGLLGELVAVLARRGLTW